jgi:hypothetical protein
MFHGALALDSEGGLRLWENGEMEEQPPPRKEEKSKTPRRFGFGLLASLALFAITRGCGAVNASPSWFVGTGWFAIAAALSIAAIWTWEHTANRHVGLRVALSALALIAFTAGAFPSIADQYRREHANAPAARVTVQADGPKGNAPTTTETAKQQLAGKRKIGNVAASPSSRPASPAPAPVVPTPNPNNPTIYAPGGVVSVNQQGGITAGQVVVNPKPSPRRLTEEQRAIMLPILLELSGSTVTIQSIFNDSDGDKYSLDFVDLFGVKAGWNPSDPLKNSIVYMAGDIPSGIRIVVHRIEDRNDRRVLAIAKALTAAKIEFSVHYENQNVAVGEVVLQIGIRPE